jgi:site-specific recombinase XerD
MATAQSNNSSNSPTNSSVNNQNGNGNSNGNHNGNKESLSQSSSDAPPKEGMETAAENTESAKLGKSEWNEAKKSFLGYLKGTDRSELTQSNYESDLHSFERFMEEREGVSLDRPEMLKRIQSQTLDRYAEYLAAEGLKTNTRRRKLLTIRKLFRYLKGRRKISVDLAGRIPAPGRLERVPQTLPKEAMIRALDLQWTQETEPTLAMHRNLLLVELLLESGALLSEVCAMTWGQIQRQGGKAQVEIVGKSPRTVEISESLMKRLEAFKVRLEVLRTGLTLPEIPVFTRGPQASFTRPLAGQLTASISSLTPRAVQLILKDLEPVLADKLEGGIPDGGLTPRLLRHSAVKSWAETGVPREEVKRRLGLRTDYAFRVYSTFFPEGSIDRRKRPMQEDLFS